MRFTLEIGHQIYGTNSQSFNITRANIFGYEHRSQFSLSQASGFISCVNNFACYAVNISLLSICCCHCVSSVLATRNLCICVPANGYSILRTTLISLYIIIVIHCYHTRHLSCLEPTVTIVTDWCVILRSAKFPVVCS